MRTLPNRSSLQLMVAGLGLLALLTGLAGCAGQQGAASAVATPTFAGFAGPKGQWVPVAALAGDEPAVAPEDPRVIYQVQGNGINDDGKHVVLRRSDDGGATWHTLPMPSPQAQEHVGSGMPVHDGLIPSPLDPRTAFLIVAVPYPTGCPTWPAGARAFTGGRLASGYVQCSFVYRSADGGDHWTQVHLPNGGMLTSAWEVRPVSNDPPLYAQGTRLYSYDFADIYQGRGSDRLIRSDDGGATWRPIDGPLLAQGQAVLDYVPTRTGSTIFALATPDGMDPPATLWRSDDAGASWREVGPVPFGAVDSLAVVPRPAGGEPLLYLATEPQPPNLSGLDEAAFVVSEDGGATWRLAPNGGRPTDDAEPSILGVLGDGSILARDAWPAVRGPATFTLYAWKVGDSVWRKVTSPLNADGVMLVTSAGAGHDAIWAVVSTAYGGVERWVTE